MKPITILIAKSSAGKDAIATYLSENYGYNRTISYTTRPMRVGEKNGIDYHFVNKNIFTDILLQGKFIEHRTYNTLVDNVKDTWFYGLSKENNNIDLSKQNILILDYEGCLNALQYFGASKCKVVYIDCPDDIREERARKRGSFDAIEWNRRKKSDDKVFKWSKIKDIVDLKVVNVDKTLKEICEEIVKEDK